MACGKFKEAAHRGHMCATCGHTYPVTEMCKYDNVCFSTAWDVSPKCRWIPATDAADPEEILP